MTSHLLNGNLAKNTQSRGKLQMTDRASENWPINKDWASETLVFVYWANSTPIQSNHYMADHRSTQATTLFVSPDKCPQHLKISTLSLMEKTSEWILNF